MMAWMHNETTVSGFQPRQQDGTDIILIIRLRVPKGASLASGL